MSFHSGPIMGNNIAVDVGIAPLESTGNFTSWSRDLQAIATHKGVWQFLAGTKAILNEPERDEFQATEKGYAEYRGAITDYDKQQEKITMAFQLLHFSVAPSIRRSILEHSTPADAYLTIKSQYQPSEYRVRYQAISHMESLKLTRERTMSQFIEELKSCRHDIMDANGDFSDEHLIYKIARSLPRDYDAFVQDNIQLVDRAPKLDEIVSKLLALEPRILERQKSDSKNKIDHKGGGSQDKTGGGRGRQSNGKDRDNKKSGDPNKVCTGCGRTGHTYEQCRSTNPVVQAKIIEQAKQENGGDNKTHNAAVAIAEDKSRRRFAAVAISDLSILQQKRTELQSTQSEGSLGMSIPTTTPITPANLMTQTTTSSKANEADGLREAEGCRVGIVDIPGIGPAQIIEGAQDRSSSQDYQLVHGKSRQIRDSMVPIATSNYYSCLSDECVSTSTPIDDPTSIVEDARRRVMAAARKGVAPNTWLMDSGANVHIVNDIKYFVELHSFSTDIDTASSNSTLEVAGEGTVVVIVQSPAGEEIEIEMTEVMYIPNARCHLVSLSALAEKGNFSGKWGRHNMSLEHGGQVICTAQCSKGLYILPVKSDYPTIPSGTRLAGNVDLSHPVWKWHARLGHPSIENMRILLRNSKGMNLTDAQLKAKIKAVCTTCATTKATNKIPRDPAARDFLEPGDMLHVDTWGPYHVDSYDGTKLFMVVTDHATRFVWAVRMADKADLVKKIILLHRQLEKKYKMTIRSYRMDNEIARVKVFQDFITRRGITLEPTVPWAHYMNGIAERGMRTIREKASSNIFHSKTPDVIKEIVTNRTSELLRDVDVPDKLWPEAFEHAVWSKNRTPTRANKSGKTPWELLKGVVPDLEVERIWGSRTIVTIPPEKRGPKLHSPRSWEGRIMGCIEESAYRVWNPEKQKVFRVSMPRVVEYQDGADAAADDQSLSTASPTQDSHSGTPHYQTSSHPLSQHDDFGNFDDDIENMSTTAPHSLEDMVASDKDTEDYPGVLEGLDIESDDDGCYYGGEDNIPDDSPVLQEPKDGAVSRFFFTGALAMMLTPETSAQEPGEQALRLTIKNSALMTDSEEQPPFVGMASTKRKRGLDDDLDSETGGEADMSDGSVDLVLDDAAAITARAKEAKARKEYAAARAAWIEQQKDHKNTYFRCTKCQDFVLKILPSPQGILCTKCSQKIPDPAECALCTRKSSPSWHHHEKGKICNQCKLGLRSKEKKTRCPKCQRTVLKIVETGEGTICHSCAAKIPDPTECSGCRNPNITTFLHSSAGKVCSSCLQALKTKDKPIPHQEPCMRCHTYGLDCDKVGKSICTNCKAGGHKCIKKFGDTVPKPDKCGPCAGKNFSCDHARPCKQCVERKITYRCLPQYSPAPQKCAYCITLGTNCELARPCRFCVNSITYGSAAHRCMDIDTENLVMIIYPTKPKEIEEWKVRDHSICIACARRGNRCSGREEHNEPCLQCVNAKEYESFCSWTTDEGIMTKVPTLAFMVGYTRNDIKEPRVVRDPEISEDLNLKDLQRGGALSQRAYRKVHQDHTKSKVQQKRLQAMAEDSDSETESQPGAKQAQAKRKPMTSRPVHMTSEHDLDLSEASTAFADMFPNGYTLLQTDHTGLKCALFAIIHSLESLQKQGIALPVPTFHELDTWSKSDEYRARMDEVMLPDMHNDRNYHVDQAALIVQMWAERTHAFPLRLGWVTPNSRPMLVSYAPLHEDTVMGEPQVFFIHNDNAAAAFPNNISVLNHFEGMEAAQVISSSPTTNKSSAEDYLSSIPDSFDTSVSKIRSFANKFAALSIMDLDLQPEPTSFAEAMRRLDSTKWKAGMDAEMAGLISKGVWEEARLPQGRKALTVKWVYKYKIAPNGELVRWKARLVARGFQQEEGIDYNETYAPVARHPTYRLLFAIAKVFGWPAHQVDILQAFLNSDLDEEVYVKSAPGYRIANGMVLRLRKALYGLKQASKAWYDTLVAALQSLGFTVSPYDPCLFINYSAGIIIVTWVDDMLIFGSNNAMIRRFKAELTAKFAMTDEGPCSYYLGMQIAMTEPATTIKQSTYVLQALNKFQLQDILPKLTPGDPNKHLRRSFAANELQVPEAQRSRRTDTAFVQRYQSMVGTLNWLATITRPDIAFDTGLVARYNADPCSEHMDAVVHIFAYLKATVDFGMSVTKGTGRLVGYVDSDFANCEDTRRSTTGFIFLFNGSPISWKSSRQKLVTTSTCEAEYVAASEAAKEAIWLRNMIQHLAIPGVMVGSVPLYIDNQAARTLAQNPVHHDRSKHIDIKYHFIRERVLLGQIDIREVASKDNIADLLTKTLRPSTFIDLRTRAGILEDTNTAGQ
jgi:hypothetical protein